MGKTADLTESLEKAARDSSSRPQFYRDLMNSELYVVKGVSDGDTPTSEQAVRLTGPTAYTLRTMIFNGRTVVPAFTSLEKLEAVLDQKGSYLKLRAVDLFSYLSADATVALNPGSSSGKEFLPEEIGAIRDGSIFEVSPIVASEPRTVLVGRPSKYPHSLVIDLIRYFKSATVIKKAWLVHYHDPQSGEPPHTLIGIKVSADFHSVLGDIRFVIQNSTVLDPPVDVICIDGGQGIGKKIESDYQPFYRRKLLGLF